MECFRQVFDVADFIAYRLTMLVSAVAVLRYAVRALRS
jgi:hypothetical protein